MLRNNAQVTLQSFIVFVTAGAASIPATPSNPRRQYLLIRNVGANPALLEFGRPSDANSYSLAAGGILEFDITIPIDSLNVQSTLGTSLLIWEGT
jgi:hypothetical protein